MGFDPELEEILKSIKNKDATVESKTTPIDLPPPKKQGDLTLEEIPSKKAEPKKEELPAEKKQEKPTKKEKPPVEKPGGRPRLSAGSRAQEYPFPVKSPDCS